MDFTNPGVIRWLGANLDKGRNNHEEEENKLKDSFVKKYPFAKVEEFDFRVTINSDGDVTSSEVFYMSDRSTKLWDLNNRYWKYGWSVNSDVFKYKYSDALYFGPTQIWNPKGEKIPFALTTMKLPFDTRMFEAYVGNSSFTTNFPPIGTKWGGKDVLTAEWDVNDPYFNSLASAYVLSHLSGVCKEHFVEDSKVPKVITTIMRYFLYYHRARFSHDLSRLDQHLTSEDVKAIRNMAPTKKVWVTKRLYGYKGYHPSHWLREQPNKANIKNVGYIGKSKYGGVLGIMWEEVSSVIPRDPKDWMSFIQDTSTGFTPKGQLSLQEAVQSYVYAVLGAQARTRFRIIGLGAKSLQTQQIFHNIVKDTVALDDDSVLISNMRKAIADTNVLLDTTIIPGVVLIPSNLIILDKPVAGFNNVLTTATASMQFGKNPGLNKKAPKSPQSPEKFHLSSERNITDEETPTKTPFPKPTTSTTPVNFLPKVKSSQGLVHQSELLSTLVVSALGSIIVYLLL